MHSGLIKRKQLLVLLLMKNNSPSKKIWNRFKRNKLAFGGLIFILLLMIIGILGYLITPDQTPFANNQILQISKEKPGTTFKFLIVEAFTLMFQEKSLLFNTIPSTETSIP